MAMSQIMQKKKQLRTQQASQEAAQQIDDFETNLRRLVSESRKGPEEDAGASLEPDEHFQHMAEAYVSKVSNLGEDAKNYLSMLKARQKEEAASRKEREVRRCRLLVEQQEASISKEQSNQVEVLLEALKRESGEEAAVAARLKQLEHEKDVMTENRLLREQQYAERRQRDWEEALQRELELHRSLREGYRATKAAALESWHATQEECKKAKSFKRQNMCRSMAWQIAAIAERAAKYREITGTNVPVHKFREWLALFFADSSELAVEIEEEEVQEKSPGPQDEASMEDYMLCAGEWTLQPAIGYNQEMAAIVANLANEVHPWHHTDKPTEQALPLRIAVVGPPFSGRTTIATQLAKAFSLALLQPEVMVKEAITAAHVYGSTTNGNQPPVATAGSAEPCEVPAKVQIGRQLQEALQSGQQVPDHLLVQLVVINIAEVHTRLHEPPASPVTTGTKSGKGSKPVVQAVKLQGFVLDGFPCTAEQASMMEHEFTGLDLEQEMVPIAKASRIVPAPAMTLPNIDRPLQSGLDAVIMLELCNKEVALERALGRRLDPETNRVYHLEHDLPASDSPGLSERLQEVHDLSNDGHQVHKRLEIYMQQESSLQAWFSRFQRLHRPVDSSAGLQHAVEAATDVVSSIQRSKSSATFIRSAATSAEKALKAACKAADSTATAQQHAEAAARSLLEAKRTEMQATALLNTGKNADPAAAELLKAQSAAKCAEMLKVGRQSATEASGHAENAANAAANAQQAAEQAKAALGDTNASSEAEKMAAAAADQALQSSLLAADAATKAEQAKAAADAAMAEAERLAALSEIPLDVQPIGFTAPAQEDPPQTAGIAPSDLSPELVQILHEHWQVLEKGYVEGLLMNLFNLRELRSTTIAVMQTQHQQFMEFLGRKDDKQLLVARHVTTYNAVDVDLRQLKDAQAEWILRSEDLRDSLWEICDRNMEENESERNKVVSSSFLADQSRLLCQCFASLIQVELDRYMAAHQFCLNYARSRYKHAPEDDAALRLLLPDVTTGEVPPEIKDAIEGKNAGPFPDYVVALQTKAPQLATALKVSLVCAKAAYDMEPPTDKKKSGAKGKEAPKAAPPRKPTLKGSESEQEALLSVSDAVKAMATALIGKEFELLERRFQLLAVRAAANIDELVSMGATSSTRMQTIIKNQYQAECSAVAALDTMLRSAAGRGVPLSHDLTIQGGKLVVDEGTLLIAPPRQAPIIEVEEETPRGNVPTIRQLNMLLAALSSASAGSPFLRVSDAADLFCRLAEEGVLPGGWNDVSLERMAMALGHYDHMACTYLDWRELLVGVTCMSEPALINATPMQIAATIQVLQAADDNNDGLLTKQQWETSRLWFEPQLPLVNDEISEDTNTTSTNPCSCDNGHPNLKRLKRMKALLWDMFCGQESGTDTLLDFKAAVLYLSLDRSLFLGLRKAFACMSGSASGIAKLQTKQLMKLLYPLYMKEGEALKRVVFDEAKVEDIICQVWSSRGGKGTDKPEITAEQLMYSPQAEGIVSNPLMRYQWTDVYTMSRI